MSDARRQTLPTLDIVVPLYNEEMLVGELLDRLEKIAAQVNGRIIAVDDGSRDATPQLLDQAARRNPRLTVLHFSRNFGHQAALNAGLDYASADAVVLMDGDLQDPPELIPQLLERWRQGHDVVYMIRRNRKEGPLLRACYHLFYRFLSWVSAVPVPLDSGDFCLLDRRVAEEIRRLPERSRFLRGLRSWVGFRQVGLDYSREARYAGRPKYNWRRLVNLAFDGIFSLSGNLLRYLMVLGLLIFAGSFLYAGCVVAERLFNPDSKIQGWYSTVVLISTFSGLQIFFLGLMGEYINRILLEVKGRPVYIVKEVVGGENPAAAKESR